PVAGAVVRVRPEPVAHLERERQVVAGRDHQAVTEAMGAGARQPPRAPYLPVGAESATDARQRRRVIRLQTQESPLENAVVEAREAGGRSLGEVLGDVAVVARECCGSDAMRDRVAVRV